MAEAESGAVGQRGLRVWAASCAGSRRPGWQAVPWQIGVLPTCWCCPWQEGTEGVRPGARVAGESPSLRATLPGPVPLGDPWDRGRAWLRSFWAASLAAPSL